LPIQLKCIACGAIDLAHQATGFQCSNCGKYYPTVRGVTRFVQSEQYSESFGYQWKHFTETQLDSVKGISESQDTFFQKTGWDLCNLRNKVVLDVGCGMGRFTEVAANAGAEVHAVDLSTAVEVARYNLRKRQKLSFYQADAFHLPFIERSFDYIFSIGVLHHTPSTREAFLKLPRLLKPGGKIAIWVYGERLKKIAWMSDNIWRKLTVRLSKKTLLKIARLALPLYHFYRIPLLGRIPFFIFFTSEHPNREWRWLDTFDWYSPKYQWKHSYEEVEGWFREAGLINIARLSFPVAVQGKRPE
jgi:ubiquinone/menaquinone biosynthesis C-methylase UbiE